MQVFDHLQRDIRHAARRLAHDWRFTMAAVSILALGIGANTATFSVVNAAMFRERPFADQDSLVEIYQNSGGSRSPALTSFPAYRDIAEYTDIFSGVSAVLLNGVKYRADGALRSALVEYATSSHLSLLGLRPAAGRWFSAEEDLPGSEAVAVLGYHTWRTRFEADPAVLGRTVSMNGVPVTIVGIAPVGFHNTVSMGLVTDFWVSTGSIPSVEAYTLRPGLLDRRRELTFFVKARLREGVTIVQARAAMSALGDRLASEFPDDDPGQGIVVFGFNEVRVHPAADAAILPLASLLLTIVGLVLAIACTNLATLLLVRGSSRFKEMSVRLALGASRGQLVRHLLAENILLAAAGGAIGFVLAYALTRVVAALDLPLVFDLSLDLRVLAYTTLLSIVTGVSFGLAPSLKATRIDLVSSLRDEEGTMSLGRRRFGLTNSLVVFQVGVSFLLLVSAVMLIRLMVSARAFDVGFAVDGVAILETDPRYAGYAGPAARQFHETLLERVRAIPGVNAAVLSNGAPIDGFTGSRRLVLDDSRDPTTLIEWKWAGPEYFTTLRIPVLFGREFDTRDRLSTLPVAIINETMARDLFGTLNAVGRRFRSEEDPASWTEVVGVVRDTDTEIFDPPKPLFYRSVTQSESPTPTIMARTSLDAADLAGAMLREMRALDPQVPVITARTMRQQVDNSMAGPGMSAVVGILSGLGVLGLALAGVGLYAVVAFGVSRRATEVGIRMALGARAVQVVRLVTRDVATLVFVGIGVGVFLSAFATLAIWSATGGMLASTNLALSGPLADVASIAGVAVLMMVISSAAAFFPVRRATRIDPMAALRHH